MAHKLPLINFKEHVGEAYGVAWSHIAPTLVLSASADSTVKLYDISKPMPIGNFVEHKSVSIILTGTQLWETSLPQLAGI